MSASVTEPCHAKLNLALSVGPPGVDRMHPIASWMVTIDLADELTVTRLAPESLSRYAILWHEDARRTSEIDWSVTKDLAVRAHLALEQHTGRDLPVQMLLRKRIPVGAGLGGGSANAAAMLRVANRLFDLGLTTADLIEIASGLGSDVPFLVVGGSAVVEGLGDRVVPTRPVEDAHFVLVFPEEACPTGRVYAAFDDLLARKTHAGVQSERVRELAEAGRLRHEACFNDLTDAALRVAPSLSRLRCEIGAIAERDVHLSGSGSTLFVPCDDAMHAEALAAAIANRLNMPAVATRTVAHSTPTG